MTTYLWVLHAISLLWVIIGFLFLIDTSQARGETNLLLALWAIAAGVFAMAAVLSS